MFVIIFDNRKKQQMYIVLKLVYIDLTFKIPYFPAYNTRVIYTKKI